MSAAVPPMATTLPYPMPEGVRVLRESPETVTLLLTLPRGVAELLSVALELAGRLTQSDKPGAQIAAVCMEVVGEWSAQAEEQQRQARGGRGGRDVEA